MFTEDSSIREFMIFSDQFINIDSKIRYNSVDINFQRFKIWQKDQHFDFIDFTQGESFWGLPFEYDSLTSYDGGKTYKKENGHLLFQLKF